MLADRVGDNQRLHTHFHGQCFRNRGCHSWRAHHTPGLPHAHKINAGSGEFHERVEGNGNDPCRSRGSQHLDSMTDRCVGNNLSGLPTAHPGHTLDELRNLRIWQSQHDQFAALDEVRNIEKYNARDNAGNPVEIAIRGLAHPHDVMTGPGQCRGDDRTHSTGTNNADAQAGWIHHDDTLRRLEALGVAAAIAVIDAPLTADHQVSAWA